MEKRLLLAVSLSILILIIWSAIVPKSPSTTKIVDQPSLPIQAIPLQAEINREIIPDFLLQCNQDKYEITFTESQAAVKQVVFKDFQSYQFLLKYGFLLGNKDLIFKKEEISAQQAIFSYKDQNKQITKQFIFQNSNYSIELGVETKNLSTVPLSIDYPLIVGVLDFKTNQDQARFKDITVALQDKKTPLHLDGRKNLVFEQPKFISLRDRYFCNIIEPAENNYKVLVKKITPNETEVSLVIQNVLVEPGKTFKEKFHIYLGPQELQRIKDINPAWASVMYYGMFDFISQLLLKILEFFYRIVHNWGWAIVLLSIAIYFILYPLSLKQMRSMKKMQAIQPRVEELRKAHKDNPQKLHKEILELYREHGINPFSGCLPLLLQMPIFFALYQSLIRYVALKGATFLWIKDLSEPDRLFTLPISFPFLNNELNILPLLMTTLMFIQQKFSLSTTSMDSSKEQQKIMMIIFPLMFGLIFYHMPAGLVLYWFINSLLTTTQQLSINRKT